MLPFWLRKAISLMFSPEHHRCQGIEGRSYNSLPFSHVTISNKNICDLKEPSDLFLLLCFSGWGGERFTGKTMHISLFFQLEGKRSVEIVTWLWKDMTPWSQLEHPDTLQTAFCPGWQGTTCSLILINLASVTYRWARAGVPIHSDAFPSLYLQMMNAERH